MITLGTRQSSTKHGHTSLTSRKLGTEPRGSKYLSTKDLDLKDHVHDGPWDLIDFGT